MKDKIRAACLSMLALMERVEGEGTHGYVRKSDGKLLAGVTGVIKVLPKDFLAAWGGKECAKYLGFTDDENLEPAEKRLAEIKGLDAEAYKKLLGEAKGAAFRKSKEAKETGTDGHAWLESYVKAKMRGEPLPVIPDDGLKRALTQFVEWETRNVKEWLISEALIYQPEHEYAGTLDAAAVLKDGRLALIDFKFSNQISEEYYLQTAAYAYPFNAYGITFDARIIVRLPKTEVKMVYNRKTRVYDTVPNDLEVFEVPTSYDFDLQTFLAARQVYKWTNQFKKD